MSELNDMCIFRHFVSFYYSLRGDGMDFPEEDEDDPSKAKKKEPVSTDPNTVSSQQEADDIAKGKDKCFAKGHAIKLCVHPTFTFV